MENNALMRQLVDELNQASDAYYNGRGELMTDYEWDAKFDQLRRLEEATGEVLPDSPTHKVSADTTAGQKEAHEYPHSPGQDQETRRPRQMGRGTSHLAVMEA